jgi:hypothetical protein
MVVLLGGIALFVLLGLLAPDREFSQGENRKLAQKPEFSLSALAEGKLFEDLGSYLADQFPGRDMWIGLNLRMNRFFGQKETGGVYLCRDGYLIQAPGEPDEANLDRNIRAINRFGARHSGLKITMSVIPNAATIHADRLPANAPVRDQRADLADLQARVTGAVFADVTEALERYSDEYLFYKTDHHWTSLGAGRAFTALAPTLGISAPSLDSYTVYPVSDSFEGTLSSRTGSHAARDRVDIYVPKTEVSYSVNYVDSQKRVASLYNRAALEQKGHYTVFFGGNHSRVDITTTAGTGRCLLLLKDSYANCFVQFLYPHYDRILMVDPRYYYGDLENLISSQSVTDVLYLYNLDTFLSDSSLADVLGAE